MTVEAQALGRRILLWGGGGKTTLARALGKRLGLPAVELDALFWLPDWVERDADEFRQLVAATIAGHEGGWIVDGQYNSKLGGDVLRQADTLIWIELPWRVIFWRVLKRSIARAKDQKRICGENYESWRQTFCSRDSLLWFAIKMRLSRSWKTLIPRREEMIAKHAPDIEVIRLFTPDALDEFYVRHELERPHVD